MALDAYELAATRALDPVEAGRQIGHPPGRAAEHDPMDVGRALEPVDPQDADRLHEPDDVPRRNVTAPARTGGTRPSRVNGAGGAFITTVGCSARAPKSSAKTTRQKESEHRAYATGVNRLADETSPYLLQHAGNPVDWYPWGEDALRARAGRGPRRSCSRSATPRVTGAT